MIDYYRVLRLKPGASAQEIKKAYHRYAFHFHPDRNKEKGELFHVVREAYEKLMELAGAKKEAVRQGVSGEKKSREPHHVITVRKKARHNLSFVTSKIKKERPDFYRYRVQKVIVEKNQCSVCSGYGVVQNRFKQAVNCRECGGTGSSKNINYSLL